MTEQEACGAPALGGPCKLPKGHNMGCADVPENHSAVPIASPAEYTRQLEADLRKVYEISNRFSQLDPQVYNEAYRRGAAACAWEIADHFGWH
jgi:hypothetical protein